MPIGQSTSASGLIAGDLAAKVDKRNFVHLHNETTGDLIILTPDEARQLRDWLKEMLP